MIPWVDAVSHKVGNGKRADTDWVASFVDIDGGWNVLRQTKPCMNIAIAYRELALLIANDLKTALEDVDRYEYRGTSFDDEGD